MLNEVSARGLIGFLQRVPRHPLVARRLGSMDQKEDIRVPLGHPCLVAALVLRDEILGRVSRAPRSAGTPRTGRSVQNQNGLWRRLLLQHASLPVWLL